MPRLPGSQGGGRGGEVVGLLTHAAWPRAPVSHVRNPGPGTLRFSLTAGYDPAVAGVVLLERETELAVVGGLVAQAAGGEGCVALIEGPPGIGKTSLVTAAARLAAEAGMRCLSARGSPMERAFPFGVVR